MLRTEAVFIVLTVLFFTMVFPGLTLPWLVQAQDAMNQGSGVLTMSLSKSFIIGEHKLDREEAEQLFKTTEMRIISAQKELDDEALRVATRQLPVVGGADARDRE
ncbi:hypothetical protein [Rothia nasimurium]|uniref:hypothetical protein n=1 Tax=Rothia nasimurium TaxID=85336 RepID=UPI002DD63B9D|nr:hypothetical protein [Rothia nasimurium]